MAVSAHLEALKLDLESDKRKTSGNTLDNITTSREHFLEASKIREHSANLFQQSAEYYRDLLKTGEYGFEMAFSYRAMYYSHFYKGRAFRTMGKKKEALIEYEKMMDWLEQSIQCLEDVIGFGGDEYFYVEEMHTELLKIQRLGSKRVDSLRSYSKSLHTDNMLPD